MEEKKNKCLKEVNPESYPGLYHGKPFSYNPDDGSCVQCEERIRSECKSKPTTILKRRNDGKISVKV